MNRVSSRPTVIESLRAFPRDSPFVEQGVVSCARGADNRERYLRVALDGRVIP